MRVEKFTRLGLEIDKCMFDEDWARIQNLTYCLIVNDRKLSVDEKGEERFFLLDFVTYRCSNNPEAYEIQIELLDSKSVKNVLSRSYPAAFRTVRAFVFAYLAQRQTCGSVSSKISAMLHRKLPVMCRLLGGRTDEANRLMDMAHINMEFVPIMLD